MPTLSGRYTVSELCNQLGASAPWVRKIETLGLIESSDQKRKGKRRFYTAQEARIISDVVTLRHLGFEFEEIGYLKQLEEELWPLIQKSVEASVQRLPTTEDWINTIFYGDFNGVLRIERLTDRERMTFLGKLQDHERMITRIRDAVVSRIQVFTDVQQRMNTWLGSHSLLLRKLKR